TVPLTFTQVSAPATFTKPGPYAAQELPDDALRSGSTLPEGVALSGFARLGGSASTLEAGDSRTAITSRDFFIPPFSAAGRPALPDELDADRLAAAPDHLALPPGPGVARKRQAQFGRQR